MKRECRGYTYHLTVFCLLLAAALFLAGCTNPEKAKAEHVAQGEAYLKDLKFQEASLEFRNAIQIDDSLTAAHWAWHAPSKVSSVFRKCSTNCGRR